MFMRLLDASYETTVYYENDSRAFDCYAMRPPDVIQELIGRSPSKVVVVKALHEAHRIASLLDRFAPANALWIIRSFEGVVNSSLHHWPGWRNKIDQLIEDRGAADWRGLGMTDQTHSILRAHYRPGLSDASTQALFWYYRHQLFFDQRLERDPRVETVVYEETIGTPHAVTQRIANFLNIKPTARMARIAQMQPTPHVPADVSPEIRELCTRMQQRLLEAHRYNL